DEWVARPQEARIKMGTEIDSAVAQSLLNESSAIRIGEAPPPPEKIEQRKKWVVRLSSGGGVIAFMILFMYWHQIYPAIERLAGNSYAMKLIEDRRIQSIYDPPKTAQFHENYTDNVLYMKNYYEIKVDPKYIEQWTLRLNNLELLKPMGLSEESIVKF